MAVAGYAADSNSIAGHLVAVAVAEAVIPGCKVTWWTSRIFFISLRTLSY